MQIDRWWVEDLNCHMPCGFQQCLVLQSSKTVSNGTMDLGRKVWHRATPVGVLPLPISGTWTLLALLDYMPLHSRRIKTMVCGQILVPYLLADKSETLSLAYCL